MKGIPIEVDPFGFDAVVVQLKHIAGLYGEMPEEAVEPRRKENGQLYVTDGGNNIADLKLRKCSDPARLEKQLNEIIGVIENGLFVGKANKLFLGDDETG